METARTISFRDFKLTIKPANKPEAVLVIFHGGTDFDGAGWENASGDRKKLEDDFKFMFNPYEAPSLKNGEYMLHFKLPGKRQKFFDWIDKQKGLLGGIEDDK